MPSRAFSFALALAACSAAGMLALPLVGEREASAQKPKPKKDKEKASAAQKKVPRATIKETKPVPKTPEKVKDEPAPPPDAAGGPPGELRGPTRIDFDDRLIQGQTNKSGAVYLFDRKETGISSMVRRRKSFRQLTLGTIYDR